MRCGGSSGILAPGRCPLPPMYGLHEWPRFDTGHRSPEEHRGSQRIPGRTRWHADAVGRAGWRANEHGAARAKGRPLSVRPVSSPAPASCSCVNRHLCSPLVTTRVSGSPRLAQVGAATSKTSTDQPPRLPRQVHAREARWASWMAGCREAIAGDGLRCPGEQRDGLMARRRD